MNPRVFVAVSLAILASQLVAAPHRDTDANERKIILNKYQVAAVELVLREMKRIGYSARGLQMHLEDRGSYFTVAFWEDPQDMAVAGGDGIEWRVSKRGTKILRRNYMR
jgi:hypothetical protein